MSVEPVISASYYTNIIRNIDKNEILLTALSSNSISSNVLSRKYFYLDVIYSVPHYVEVIGIN